MKRKARINKIHVLRRQIDSARRLLTRAKKRRDSEALVNKLKNRIASKYSEVREQQAQLRKQSAIWERIETCNISLSGLCKRMWKPINTFDVDNSRMLLEEIKRNAEDALSLLEKAERI